MAFKIVRDDITRIAADAIVNTANPKVEIGAGVDAAIYAAAGREQLLRARGKIGELQPGEVGITPAFHLSAKYIIHSSGPWYQDGLHGEKEILRRCYDKSLALALQKHCKSIAFPLLSTGTYGFPEELGIQVAVSAFTDFLMDHEMEITLVVFGNHAYKISGKLFDEVESYIDDLYVETKAKEQKFQAGRDRDFEDGTSFYFGAEEDSAPPSMLLRQETSPMAANLPRPAMQRDFTGESGSKSKSRKPSLSLEERLKAMYQDSFPKHLRQLIHKKGLKNSEVYAAANISKQYFSKLLKGKVNPSKEKILALAVGLRLNMDEAVDFLKVAGYAFSPVSQTDVIVEYFLQKQEYNVMKLDIVLFDYGLPGLSE